MTALLYLVRAGQNEELRYSLRSVAANLPHSEVWIAGHPPSWLVGAGVIATTDRGARKWPRIVDALEAACTDRALPEELVYLNDDMFVIEPMTCVPVYHRGALAAQRGYRAPGGHSAGIAETERLMKALGLDGPFLSYELHVPMPISRHLMATSIDAARRRAPRIRCLHYRTLYGNTWGSGGDELEDVKVHGVGAGPAGPLVSTNDDAFARGAVGRQIRARFPDPSPYERSGT